jgi:NAD(P)-dependent dehydrogenase (short-subunit alcohol dehydrogenase family)
MVGGLPRGFIFGREVARRMLPRGYGTIIYSGASAALRGRAAFAPFAAAKAGLRMVSQSFAREFGPRGIHVAHVIIDGSINGDKIFSKVPDIGQQKGPDGLLDPDAIADSFGIYIRNIVLLGRRSSMCVHMQKPFEPRQAHFITWVAS